MSEPARDGLKSVKHTPEPWTLGWRHTGFDENGDESYIRWNDEPRDDARPIPRLFGVPITHIHARRIGEQHERVILSEEGGMLAILHGVVTGPEREANGRLMIAAPALLAALKEIIRIRREVHGNQDNAVDVAVAAIDLAEPKATAP